MILFKVGDVFKYYELLGFVIGIITKLPTPQHPDYRYKTIKNTTIWVDAPSFGYNTIAHRQSVLLTSSPLAILLYT